MNIAQIVSHSYPSGTSRHVLILTAALQRRGHVVTLLCPPDKWMSAQVQALGVEFHETRMRGPHFWRQVQAAADWLRTSRADVIHTHTARGASYGLLLSLASRLPVVASVHVRSRDVVYRRLMPRGRNRVVAVSNFVRDTLIAHGAPASRIQTIYNATDFLDSPNAPAIPEPGVAWDGLTNGRSAQAKSAIRAELGLPASALLVGVFGHISALKGQDLVAQAAPQIVAGCPSVYFVFVGPIASSELQQSILAQAAQEGLADRFVFTGYRADVARLMDAMDVVAVPSEIEACSMVTLEAMALGRPIVAAKVGGMPELVSHGETGLLVERESAAFANALLALMQAPLTRARMGQAGYARAASCFTTARLACQFENLYSDMIASKSRR